MKTDTGIQIIRMSQRMMSNQSGSASIGELCSSNDQCSIFSKTSVSVSDYQYFSTWIIDDVGKSIIIIPVQYELLQAPLFMLSDSISVFELTGVVKTCPSCALACFSSRAIHKGYQSTYFLSRVSLLLAGRTMQ